jgi:hypothetical protein
MFDGYLSIFPPRTEEMHSLKIDRDLNFLQSFTANFNQVVPSHFFIFPDLDFGFELWI